MSPTALSHYQILIVGAGAAGIAVAASLQARAPDLDIAIIDPADTHYYQPGWTLVGAGVFRPESTARPMAELIPRGVRWIKAAVSAFDPQGQEVVLSDQSRVGYQQLIVCPGLKLDWAAIDGLEATLGRNGVTSNYRYDLAPYTWKLVQELKPGPVQPAADADQMCRCATEGPVPVLRSLAQKRVPGADQRALLQRRRGAVRRGRLCAGTDGIYPQVRG